MSRPLPQRSRHKRPPDGSTRPRPNMARSHQQPLCRLQQSRLQLGLAAWHPQNSACCNRRRQPPPSTNIQLRTLCRTQEASRAAPAPARRKRWQRQRHQLHWRDGTPLAQQRLCFLGRQRSSRHRRAEEPSRATQLPSSNAARRIRSSLSLEGLRTTARDR